MSFSANDFWVNAYFDTSDGDSIDCEWTHSNCNDKVKFKDDTVWTFLSGMVVKFRNNYQYKACIKLLRDPKFEAEQCSRSKRMLCYLDCCKFFQRFL